MDQSHLDKKYFIDDKVYNCPFCNRNNVAYKLVEKFEYDFSENKKCYILIARCSSCSNDSMHSSFTDISGWVTNYGRSNLEIIEEYKNNIDDYIFHSQPSSFFIIDNRIPKVLRELITEAQDCLKMNFLTGASACVRKAIYEFLNSQKVEGKDYDERIKSLKSKLPQVEADYFDILKSIKDMTSEKVHEQSWDKWDNKHLRFILDTLMAIFIEVYVIPDEKSKRKKSILELKQQISQSK